MFGIPIFKTIWLHKINQSRKSILRPSKQRNVHDYFSMLCLGSFVVDNDDDGDCYYCNTRCVCHTDNCNPIASKLAIAYIHNIHAREQNKK